MKKKSLLILAVVLLALLSVWQVTLATVEWPPLGDQGSIKVHKFHDVNRNGVQDEGEGDIEGWLIRIYRWDWTGLYMVAEGTTGGDGTVTFSGLEAPTQYKVWEEERDCWEPTTPTGMNYWSHDEHPGYYTLVWTVSNETVTVEFGNVDNCAPPPPAGEGCTPGFWKNPKRVDLWPLVPGDDFDTTFGVDLFNPDITLGEAVRLGGGGVKKLARHGTAALLNAVSGDVDYPLSEADVIAAVQAGDADALAEANELGCPFD